MNADLIPQIIAWVSAGMFVVAVPTATARLLYFMWSGK